MAISRISRIEPYAFSPTSRQRGLRHLSFRGWPDFSPPEPTAQQLFEMAMAKDMKRRSFMDKLTGAGSTVFSGGWHGLEWTFDKLMRPTYAFAGAVAAEDKYDREHGGNKTLFEDPGHNWAGFKKGLHAFARGLKGEEKKTYSDVIKHYRFFREHKKTRGIVGFGLDVALDPTTYVTFGTTAVAKGGAKGGMAAAHQLGEHALKGEVLNKAGKVVVRPQRRYEAPYWERTQKELKAAGPDFEQRAALAGERLHFSKLKTVNEGDQARLSQAREAARREREGLSDRRLRIGAGRGSILTPIPMPRTGAVGNLLAKSPIIGKPFGHLRTAFGAGKADIVRGIRVTTKHTMERLSGRYVEDVRKFLETMPRKMDNERLIHVLSRFEQKGSVVKKVDKRSGAVDYVLNEQKIKGLKKAGKMTDDEERFLRGWHEVAQHFYHQDKAFGINLEHMGEHGRIYLPHLMDRAGLPYTVAQKNMLKKQGYTKGRKNTNLSLEHIANLVKEGKLPRSIETDPYRMLVHMARSRAHQHADTAALDYIQRAVGVPRRIITDADRKRLATAEKELSVLEGKMAKYDTPGKRNLKQYKSMVAKTKELNKRIKNAKRGRKNKDVTPDLVDISTKDALRDEFGNKILVEPEIAAALKRVEKIVDPTEDVALSKFARGWASMVGRWKLLVTAVNPGYRVRNTLSDFWNMYVAGVPTWAFGRYGARAARVMTQAKKGDPKALRIINDAYDAGILSGLFGGDIDTIAHMLKYAGSKKALLKRGRWVKLGSKVAQDVNRNAENWGRMVHYLYRREHENMNIADAAWEVKKAHFDYEDLTDFERKKMKVVFPFYTWTRKNVPYQIQAIVTHPGKYSTFPKFAIESEKAAGGDEGTILPEYMTNNFSFQLPIGKHTYYTPQLGMADLARFGSDDDTAFRNVMSMTNPFVKIPFEIATNKSLFTGQEINPETGHPRQPISDWAAPFLSLIPGSNVGQTKRGDKVGMGASPWLTYAFGQSPWTRSIFLGGKIKKDQRGYSNWWGQIGGQQITRIDPEQQLMFERMALKDKLKRRIRGLRDEGRFPEAEEIRRQSEYELMIQRMIARGLGRP